MYKEKFENLTCKILFMKMFFQNQKRKFLTLDNGLDNYDDIKNNKYSIQLKYRVSNEI